MAYDGKSQSKMDALGVPPFQETSIIIYGTMDVPGKQMMFWRVFFVNSGYSIQIKIHGLSSVSEREPFWF
jgi:hypothetical protein